MTSGESVLEIFKNALHHYDNVLRELKNSKEFEDILAMLQEDIHKNLDNNTSLITQINSPDGLITVENNRKFLCGCLRGYLSYLERTKSFINTKLVDDYSLPAIKLTKIDEEIRKAESILKSSCEDKGM
jgi:predicted transcriptional regulator with HTH domain